MMGWIERWRQGWEDLGFGVPEYIRKQIGCGVQHFDFDVKAEEGVVYLYYYWGSKLINSNIIIKCLKRIKTKIKEEEEER